MREWVFRLFMAQRRQDTRYRKDRVVRESREWERQMDALVSAYLEWDMNGPPPEPMTNEGGDMHEAILVFDIMGMSVRVSFVDWH